MNKIIKISISFMVLEICFLLPAISQSVITLEEVQQTGLHLLEITTNNQEEPEGEIIESPLFPGSYNMVYKKEEI